MNLDPSFEVVRTMLTTQPTEPTLASVKKMLTDQEDTQLVLKGDTLESALYSKGKTSQGRQNARAKATSDEDDDGPSYDWLNPRNNDVCHRCGLPGHRSSRCIADMPKKIKDKVIREAKERRQKRNGDEESGNLARYIASDSDEILSESDPDSDEEFGGHAQAIDPRVSKEAQALLRRVRI